MIDKETLCLLWDHIRLDKSLITPEKTTFKPYKLVVSKNLVEIFGKNENGDIEVRSFPSLRIVALLHKEPLDPPMDL